MPTAPTAVVIVWADRSPFFCRYVQYEGTDFRTYYIRIFGDGRMGERTHHIYSPILRVALFLFVFVHQLQFASQLLGSP